MNRSQIVSKNDIRNFGSGSQDTCQFVQLDGDWYNKISHSDRLPEFMMTLTSSSNHWMFVSSYGAITAGRRNADNAIFPYYASDKIVDTRRQTGPRTIIRVSDGNAEQVWKPFWDANPTDPESTRNLFKSPLGNKLCFEEHNARLGLIFRYRWSFSHQFGFVRSAKILNVGEKDYSIKLIDGIQNIVPYGVDEAFQLQYGNLINAYKKNEITETGLGVFYLSSIPTDRAEPSEGLRATVAWTTKTPNAILLSDQQLESFEYGKDVKTETDIRGRRGDYLLNYNFELGKGEELDWDIVANNELDQTDVIDLAAKIQSDSIGEDVNREIELCEQQLMQMIAKSDGFQVSDRSGKSLRHQSNVLFNVMRGGVPIQDYDINCDDLRNHVAAANCIVAERNSEFLEGLPDQLDRATLLEQLAEQPDKHLRRIVTEYLPLVFSRRHGDPTRPWNKFSIESHLADAERSFYYQGNWRDIFQNWEALAYSYPQFLPSMICRFVNASTADGYNPYRVTKNGFEWESPEPDNPWANIGYWCDHQIIYLGKLLELSRQIYPNQLNELLDDRSFVYANVPYRIKPIEEILEDPCDTVTFEAELSRRLEDESCSLGNDAKLLKDSNGEIVSATLAEKLLLTFLVKMSNFVPDGGVWLNTQRPEWNDANNALVGRGLSVVTTCYMRRYARFLLEWLAESDSGSLKIQNDIVRFMERVQLAISPYVVSEEIKVSASQRHQIVMDLSTAGSKYRENLYENGLSSELIDIKTESLTQFLGQCCQLLESTIESNRRSDGLFHSYNLMSLDVGNEIQIERLYEMLEGQVAVLSSGFLSASEVTTLLDALKKSELYRSDQSSYMLYPNRELPRFTEKNIVSAGLINQSPLLLALLQNGDETVIRKDIFGNCHFNGDFRNKKDLQIAIEKLRETGQYDEHLDGASDQISSIFENVFCHHQFTGRSGTFFAYEGLGSIYWHMVSKLLLAVAEVYIQTEDSTEHEAIRESLKNHFHEIQTGLGAEKTPAAYGAFPSDPYSHTPEQAGAQQPGMTGQVKEDIISRFFEVGVRIKQGKIQFNPSLLDSEEFCQEDAELPTWCFQSKRIVVQKIPGRRFAFTFCGIPIQYVRGENSGVQIHRYDGNIETSQKLELNESQSHELFSRQATIKSIEVTF